ncbi:MAG: hypothetical protein KGI94_10675, partial [Paracoccaceae bacterium]|nr:hypothetical protein [Paracoccaceae bacterium]
MAALRLLWERMRENPGDFIDVLRPRSLISARLSEQMAKSSKKAAQDMGPRLAAMQQEDAAPQNR